MFACVPWLLNLWIYDYKLLSAFLGGLNGTYNVVVIGVVGVGPWRERCCDFDVSDNFRLHRR